MRLLHAIVRTAKLETFMLTLVVDLCSIVAPETETKTKADRARHYVFLFPTGRLRRGLLLLYAIAAFIEDLLLGLA